MVLPRPAAGDVPGRGSRWQRELFGRILERIAKLRPLDLVTCSPSRARGGSA